MEAHGGEAAASDSDSARASDADARPAMATPFWGSSSRGPETVQRRVRESGAVGASGLNGAELRGPSRAEPGLAELSRATPGRA